MLLSDLVKDIIDDKPPRVVLHGLHKIGKTTWAAGAPGPIFIQTEDGLASLKAQRLAHFPLATNYGAFEEYLGMVLEQDHDYKTLVIDTADWLQKLIYDDLCKKHKVLNVEEIGGGWGKGAAFALTYWNDTIKTLNKIRDTRGMAVIVLAHNEIKSYNPPDGEPYDRYQIKLHKAAAAMLEEWSDAILFATWLTFVDTKNKKAANRAERIIHTTSRPAWRAGTRYDLPETLPMDFNDFKNALAGK